MKRTAQQPSRQAERPPHPAKRTRFTDQARVTACRGFGTLPSARHEPGGAPLPATHELAYEIQPISGFPYGTKVASSNAWTRGTSHGEPCGPIVGTSGGVSLFGGAERSVRNPDPIRPRTARRRGWRHPPPSRAGGSPIRPVARYKGTTLTPVMKHNAGNR